MYRHLGAIQNVGSGMLEREDVIFFSSWLLAAVIDL